jgi:hypothetical protein
MSDPERQSQPGWRPSNRWSSWDSPVGLGLFFVLVAVAVDLARLAFK